jgi:hypothetical protein
MQESSMKRTTNETDWLTAIASQAGVDVRRVDEVLAARRIQPSPVPASPKRLLLKKIAFSGEKDGVADPGPFEFLWNDLDRGLWGMVTESNLKGKSSVIEVVRWLLRGRPSGNLQEDVRRWITRASLRFQVDENIYEIQADTTSEVKGTLVRIDGSTEQRLASFARDSEFETVMWNFFMREFSLEPVMNWRDGSGEDEGKAVLHGWPALAGVMFIGTDYSSLLGDMPAYTGVPIRLMQMYLGLPWISTLTAAQTVQKGIASEQAANERRHSEASAARKVRVDAIKNDLEAKRLELARTPSDAEVRVALAARSQEFSELKNAERVLEERLNREDKAIVQAKAAYAEDRHDLQAHLDAEAAGAVFRMLDPSCCPRCDAEIGDERRAKERTTHSCSVCGEEITSNADMDSIRNELWARVQASKAALDKATQDQKALTDSVQEIRLRITALDAEIQLLTTKLASFDARSRIVLEIAVLEARLSEANYDREPLESKGYEESVLKALVLETESRVKFVQVDLLKAVSERLVVYAKRFGMDNLSAAELKGNMNLSLVKGGQGTSYSRVTDGEKLRLKVAAVLAMISVAESQGVGRHPGLLIIDSPGAQEVSPKDLEELIAGLEEVSKEFSHLQVFVAAMASSAIKKHVPTERMLYARGEAALW